MFEDLRKKPFGKTKISGDSLVEHVGGDYVDHFRGGSVLIFMAITSQGHTMKLFSSKTADSRVESQRHSRTRGRQEGGQEVLNKGSLATWDADSPAAICS